MKPSTVEQLQEWFLSQCDGDWEHTQGISIETLDNPGWSLRIDLEGTTVAGRVLDWTKVERKKDDWLFFRSTGLVFEAACGPANLSEAIERFLDLVMDAESSTSKIQSDGDEDRLV